MADVYQAQDTLLGRRVAIKMLHSQYSSDEAFVKRFRREAQAAANLSHPNIVSIYDWGEAGDTYFIVMELVEGRSLRDVLKSKAPSFPGGQSKSPPKWQPPSRSPTGPDSSTATSSQATSSCRVTGR
jgi:serine/threonine protein kinase